jgi:hypothetical protein
VALEEPAERAGVRLVWSLTLCKRAGSRIWTEYPLEGLKMTKTQDQTNRVPLSGGPKGAIASRGAHTAARALKRLSATARAALRR